MRSLLALLTGAAGSLRTHIIYTYPQCNDIIYTYHSVMTSTHIHSVMTSKATLFTKLPALFFCLYHRDSIKSLFQDWGYSSFDKSAYQTCRKTCVQLSAATRIRCACNATILEVDAGGLRSSRFPAAVAQKPLPTTRL